jgi:hypothetical protein
MNIVWKQLTWTNHINQYSMNINNINKAGSAQRTSSRKPLRWWPTLKPSWSLKEQYDSICCFAYVAGFAANELNEPCCNCVSLKCYLACPDPFAPNIMQGTKGAVSRVELVGVTGDGIQTELYVIDTTKSQPGSTLLVEATKDNIISLAGRYFVHTWGYS